MATQSLTCLVNLFTACLFDPSNVVVRADSQWLMTHKDFYVTEAIVAADGFHMKSYNSGVARIEITAGGQLTHSLRLFYGLGHQSFLMTNHDRGYEYAVAGFEWTPFSRTL